MTIDERLDRLTERHEALTETVEIIASMQRENEEHLEKLMTIVEKLAEIVTSHENRLDRLEGPAQ